MKKNFYIFLLFFLGLPWAASSQTLTSSAGWGIYDSSFQPATTSSLAGVSSGRAARGGASFVSLPTFTPGASNNFNPPPQAQAGGLQVHSFTLVDAASNRDLRTLVPGETLNLQALPAYGVNIRANTLPDIVGSVVFSLSGALVRNATETAAPYALFGDKEGLYADWKPATGSYHLVATPYDAAEGTGTAGQPLSLSFQVVDQSVDIPLANAGPDQQITLPANSVLLDGRGSGVPGREESFAWTQLSGPNTPRFSSFNTAAPTVSGLVAGTYVFSLVVSYPGHSSTPDQVTVTVSPNPVEVTAYRINAGGSQVSNAIGTFGADKYFAPDPGFTYSVTSPIAGTENDAMYQNERASTTDNGNFSYALPVSNGNYQVVLHFAELYWNGPGQRIFDVALEGNTVLDNYDIYQKAGGQFSAVAETFAVSVADGTLDLGFSAGASTGGRDRPSVTAIEVIPTAGSNLFPTADAGPDQTVTLPLSGLVLEGAGSDADGSISAFAWSQVSGPSTVLFSSYSQARPTVSGLTTGTYVFSLAVTDNQQAGSAPDQVTVTVNPNPNGAVVAAAYRLNAGGGQLSNAIGTFEADNYFAPDPGFTYSVTSPIAGTENDALYQNERASMADNGTFSYALPVSNGSYKVVLHFAELYWTGPGQRIFDVALEGNTVLDNYDIYKKAGGQFKAITESLLVTVTDGVLDLGFSAGASTGGVNRPSITALEVIPNLLPVVQAGADQTLSQPASSVTLSGAAQDPDGSIVNYSWTKQSGPAASLAGANTPTFTASGLVIGTYVFRLTVSDETGATGFDEVTVTVNPDPNAGSALVSFTLVNASNEQDIRTLVAGETLNLATLPTQSLNIRANTNPGVVGSVKFALSGAQTRNITESGAPYALYGDTNGNYYPWTPAVGSYTLVATPYSGTGGGGTAGTPLSLSFQVVNQGPAARLDLSGANMQTPAAALLAFPNPNPDGRFQVLLPEAAEGEVTYELVSLSGASLLQGRLDLAQPLLVLTFDFSRQMQAAGMYYLKLQGKGFQSQLKLMRK